MALDILLLAAGGGLVGLIVLAMVFDHSVSALSVIAGLVVGALVTSGLLDIGAWLAAMLWGAVICGAVALVLNMLGSDSRSSHNRPAARSASRL